MTSYAAPTTYGTAAYAPQMASYVPQAMPQQPFMDVNVIKQQQTDATQALTSQAGLQAECDRNTQMATAQFQQQLAQSKMQLEQQYKQQTMELDMARQQREMAITQQASMMTAQAQQQKLQMEMQQKMAGMYNTMGAAAQKK